MNINPGENSNYGCQQFEPQVESAINIQRNATSENSSTFSHMKCSCAKV